MSWCEKNLEWEKYDRLTHVGLSKPDSLLRPQERQDMPDMFQGCFSNMLQGDRLGVEFAVDAHRNLLRSHGLLHDRDELRADRLSQGRHLAPGPVIENFYAVSVQHCSNKLEASLASQLSQVAMKAYDNRKLFGSAENDAVGADEDASFKFVDRNDVSGDDPRVLSLSHVSRLSQSFLEIRFEKEGPQVSYDSLGPETLTGTTLVWRALVLNDLVSDSGSPRRLEHLRRNKMRRLEEMQRLLEMIEIFQEPQAAGLEGPLRNEVLLNACWRPVAFWTLKRPMHSSGLETRLGSALTEMLIFFNLEFPQVMALDSNVGFFVSVKSFPPPYGLRPCVQKTGAFVVVGHLNLAYQFATTRLNPADHPSRGNMIPEPSQQAWPPEFLFEESLQEWLGSERSWRFAHVSVKHFPYLSQSASHSVLRCVFDCGSTLGYPGGGPLSVSGSTRLVWIWFGLAISFLSTFSQWAGCVSVWAPCRRSMRAPARFWISVGLVLQVQVGSCVSHGPALSFRYPGDVRSAALHGASDLPEGSPVFGKTQVCRDRHSSDFDSWLHDNGSYLEKLTGPTEVDFEFLNLQLERYGQSLYLPGRPYGRYAETNNRVSARRQRVQRMLKQAWGLTYARVRHEPQSPHVAFLWQAPLSMTITAFYWGWLGEAGILALSTDGLSRIGEATTAARKQLVRFRDIEYTVEFFLLQIDEPKMRFRASGQQVAKVDQPQLNAVIYLVLGRLCSHQRLWPFSGQIMRSRFRKLLSANGLERVPRSISKGLDLGSLLAGGAFRLMLVKDNPDLTRRRGRWCTIKINEIEVQEVSAIQFTSHLPKDALKQIPDGVAIFLWMLAHVQSLIRMQMPPTVWPILSRKKQPSLKRMGDAVVFNRMKMLGVDLTLLAANGRVITPAACGEKR